MELGGMIESGHLDIKAPNGDIITASIVDVRVTPAGQQPTSGPLEPLKPPIILYSQNDPRWKDEVYAGATTFGKAGCYVTCIAMIYSLTGALDEPPIVARALRNAMCFEGDLLTRPEQIPDACPGLRYDGPSDVSKDGPLRWHDIAADMDRVYKELLEGPLIMEVDFKPGGEFNQHFIIAEAWNEETGGLQIIDPWDGQRKELPEAYSPVYGGWSLARAIYGLRLLRVKE